VVAAAKGLRFRVTLASVPLFDARRIGLVILAASLVLAPHAAAAQSPGRMYWIGYLGNASVSTESCLVDAFRQGLRELGYIEGRNVAICQRPARTRMASAFLAMASLS
jgi:hypothetical protein